MFKIKKAQAERYIQPGAIIERRLHGRTETMEIVKAPYWEKKDWDNNNHWMYAVASSLPGCIIREGYINDLFNGEVWVIQAPVPDDDVQISDISIF